MYTSVPAMAGDLHVISVASEQTGQALIEEISRYASASHAPMLIILPEQQQAFQKPGDFLPFKHIKRQQGLSLFFVIPGRKDLRSWARRHGFVTSPSLEEVLDVLARDRQPPDAASTPSGPLASHAGSSRAPSPPSPFLEHSLTPPVHDALASI